MSDLYREVLLERLNNPVNLGVLESPDRQAFLQNPICGDEVKIELKIKNNIVEQAVYSGNGCAISQVSASFLAESIEGKSLEKIKKIKNNDILELMGIRPGPQREKCALLSFEVLKVALNETG